MAFEVRLYHSFILGLIGMGLMMYSAIYSTPETLHAMHVWSNLNCKVITESRNTYSHEMTTCSTNVENIKSGFSHKLQADMSTSDSMKVFTDNIKTSNVQQYQTFSTSYMSTPSNILITDYILTSNIKQPLSVHTFVTFEKTVLEEKEKFNSEAAFTTNTIYESGFKITGNHLCQKPGLKLIVLVVTAPNNEDARMGIRYTWGSFSNRIDVNVAFFLGTVLDEVIESYVRKEAELFGDIIVTQLIDSYANLTLKSISLLEWVDSYCKSVNFILKTDDDMFVNMPRLLSYINAHSDYKRSVFGRLVKNWKPMRHNTSKYYVSPSEYSRASFPDFTTGPAYLMTSDIIHDLYVNSLNKTYMKLEDVYITGIVAQESNIKRVNVRGFLNRNIPYHTCLIQRAISIHKVRYRDQFDLWKKLLDGKVKCKAIL